MKTLNHQREKIMSNGMLWILLLHGYYIISHNILTPNVSTTNTYQTRNRFQNYIVDNNILLRN